MQKLRIISGGQTGVNQIGWQAAIKLGLTTGGWMSGDYATEDKCHPEFVAIYNAQAVQNTSEDPIAANIRDSDGTAWLGTITSIYHQTREICHELNRPMIIFKNGGRFAKPSSLSSWILSKNISVLNLAGNPDSIDKLT